MSDMNSSKRGAKMNLHSALVELMQKGRLVSLFSLHYSIQGVIDSTLPCFAAFRDQTANQLRDRFQPALTHSLVEEHVNRLIDSYSAFYENDRKTPTGLVGYLRERGVSRVFLAGLAFDFCVRYSAEDARREDFTVIVVEDACRGIDIAGSVAATQSSFATLNIRCISAQKIASGAPA